MALLKSVRKSFGAWCPYKYPYLKTKAKADVTSLDLPIEDLLTRLATF